MNKENYNKPKVKKLVIIKKPKPTFMGCWQSSYMENNGDGC
jgi:hypothetical protein